MSRPLGEAQRAGLVTGFSFIGKTQQTAVANPTLAASSWSGSSGAAKPSKARGKPRHHLTPSSQPPSERSGCPFQLLSRLGQKQQGQEFPLAVGEAAPASPSPPPTPIPSDFTVAGLHSPAFKRNLVPKCWPRTCLDGFISTAEVLPLHGRCTSPLSLNRPLGWDTQAWAGLGEASPPPPRQGGSASPMITTHGLFK